MNGYLSTERDRQKSATDLEKVVRAGQWASLLMLEHDPNGDLTLDRTNDLYKAAQSVALHRAIAGNLLTSFIVVLRSGESNGPGLATLVRTSLESWARAWWILSAASSAQSEYRARAMVVEELESAKKRGIAMLSGESIDDAILRATGERASVQGAVQESTPGYTQLTRTLLVDLCGVPNEESASIYSHLSGVSHGESIFTESFSNTPHGLGISSVELPSQNLSSYTSWLTASNVLGTLHVMEAWGLPATDRETYLAKTDLANM